MDFSGSKKLYHAVVKRIYPPAFPSSLRRYKIAVLFLEYNHDNYLSLHRFRQSRCTQ